MKLHRTLRRVRETLRRSRGQPCAVCGPLPQEAGRQRGPATLAQEILARLLLELPAQRAAFASALADNDYGRLRGCAHQLAGAVAYCELPALASALSELRQALGAGDAAHIREACQRATGCMDTLMAQAGIHPP
jgi:HPt (histidine-containing phosphotransfer) domain-containing protein